MDAVTPDVVATAFDGSSLRRFQALLEADPRALWHSFAMIVMSEIGDKTFLIAAILAMRRARVTVFLGAWLSLAVMSALSAALGYILPSLIPRSLTEFAASVLFLVFGAKMLKDGLEMEGGTEAVREELREAEQEIEEEEAEAEGRNVYGNGEAISLEALEAGRGEVEDGQTEDHFVNAINSPLPPSRPATPGMASKVSRDWGRARPPLGDKREPAAKQNFKEGARNLCQLFFSPVFAQAFVLTFLGEWGDRSQIATIALAAAHNPYLVTIGTVIGHALCTSLAVLGGRYLASKISVKHVTLGGACLFLLFGLIYLYEAFADPQPLFLDMEGVDDDRTRAAAAQGVKAAAGWAKDTAASVAAHVAHVAGGVNAAGGDAVAHGAVGVAP